MVLNHIAAILVFSGPLFYVGLWMAIDPVGIASVPLWLVDRVTTFVPGFGRVIAAGHIEIPHTIRKALRVAGMALVLIAMAV